MSPPTGRPYPRFIADASRESQPYGRWAERLLERFNGACEPLVGEAGAALDPESAQWFPERGWGGRVFVPVAARGAEAEGAAPVEYFGHVSFVRPGDGEPGDLDARADFTDVVAEDNPEWQIDLNDDVIGEWRADGDRGGAVTLVWGVPLVRGAVAVTAELDKEVLDQAPVEDGRFTLVAVDAVKGFGDDLYLEVRLWDKRLNGLAAESLYDEPE
ncbi:MAG: hypothetical protein ACRDL3_04685 [Solirubrobacterales bacterium]